MQSNIRNFVLCFSMAILVASCGCGGPANPSNGGGSSSSEDNVLISEVLSFDGSVSGKVSDTQSTRSSTQSLSSSSQNVPLSFDTEGAMVHFHDIVGENLVDPNGLPIPPVQLDSDGSFRADDLPVGTDFTVCVDFDNGGECDQESCVSIPADETGLKGRLDGVVVDPLTTLVLAKLRSILNEQGINPKDLPVSPAAIVKRIVDAYIHLFETAGLDHTLTLEDIRSTDRDELADLFDGLIPAAAQTGMEIVEGNLRLERAKNVEEIVLAAAEMFLRAGFPIEDAPDGVDLTVLGDLDGVQTVSFDDLFGFVDEIGGFDEEFFDDDFVSDSVPTLEPAGFGDGLVLYIDLTAEPDRNFSNGDDVDSVPPLPVLNERVLERMARLFAQGKHITLGALYRALTNLEDGLGVRLTYSVFDPNFVGPPLVFFETSDGDGVALPLDELFGEVFDEGFGDVDIESFERDEARFHDLLERSLRQTAAPSFDRLFGGLVRGRIDGVDGLSQRIREARAHLPFNPSGPGSFFVVGEPKNNDSDSINAITVDAEVDSSGNVSFVSFNPDGTGTYWLGFTHATEFDGLVELIVRETGRRLHGPRGPAWVSMMDDSVFDAINGVSFFDFVSQSGDFFPATRVSTNLGAFDSEFAEADEDLKEKVLVLANGRGPDATPLRVRVDRLTGETVASPDGRHALMFIEHSDDTGVFALFNLDAGRPALLDDSGAFFELPPEQPENFEDFANEIDDLGDLDGLRDFEGEFGDVMIGPNGELIFPDGFDDPIGPAETGADGTPDVDSLLDSEYFEDPFLDDPFLEEDALLDGFGDDPFVDEIRADGFILVLVDEVRELPIRLESFSRVNGVEVDNDNYDPDGDPFYDDLNGNRMHDEGEPTAPFLPVVHNARDWRSTDLRLYYRRVDNDAAVDFEEVDFDSETPRNRDGVALVPRSYRARLNAHRFGRPNTALNLLTAFSPPDLFNGVHAFDRDTELDVFTAIGIVNLVMDQVHNIEVRVDVDGSGPLPARSRLVDAHLFVAPVDDPFVVLVRAIAQRAIETTEP